MIVIVVQINVKPECTESFVNESQFIQNNCKDYALAQSRLKNFDMSIFINAFENWVSYE